jgi:hypothetical protein
MNKKPDEFVKNVFNKDYCLDSNVTCQNNKNVSINFPEQNNQFTENNNRDWNICESNQLNNCNHCDFLLRGNQTCPVCDSDSKVKVSFILSASSASSALLNSSNNAIFSSCYTTHLEEDLRNNKILKGEYRNIDEKWRRFRDYNINFLDKEDE